MQGMYIVYRQTRKLITLRQEVGKREVEIQAINFTKVNCSTMKQILNKS